MKRNYRGKRQMKTNKHIQDIIREAALSRDKAAKRELLIKSGGSRSWFYDAIKKYKEIGEAFFIHKNRNNKHAQKRTHMQALEISGIFRDEYLNCNFRDFMRYLKADKRYDYQWVSYSYIYNILRSKNHCSKLAHKKTIKLLAKEEELKNRPQSLLVPSSATERAKENIHIARPRTQRRGHVVEADATFWRFSDEEIWALHGYIDEASGEVLGLYFDHQETTEGYFNALKPVLKNYGTFEVLRIDKRRTFWSEKKESSPEDSRIQFAFVAKNLGIDIQSSISPQFKPRIERLWKTIKGTITTFMEQNKVTNINEANLVLPKFVEYLNNHVVTLQKDFTTNSFKKFEGDLNIILGHKSIRVVARDLTVTYEKKKYFICNFTTPLNIPRREIMIIQCCDGNLIASLGDNYYSMIEFDNEMLYKSKVVLENEGVKPEDMPQKIKSNSVWAQSNFIFFKKKYSSWYKKHSY
ncbi:hypothetical protein [Spiroplasma clarkii]|nr:hypothetical protein [Spiroplasma clarkii]